MNGLTEDPRSGKGAIHRLKQNLTEGDDFDKILKGHVQMIKCVARIFPDDPPLTAIS